MTIVTMATRLVCAYMHLCMLGMFKCLPLAMDPAASATYQIDRKAEERQAQEERSAAAQVSSK